MDHQFECQNAPWSVKGVAQSWWEDRKGIPRYFCPGGDEQPPGNGRNSSAPVCQCNCDSTPAAAADTCKQTFHCPGNSCSKHFFAHPRRHQEQISLARHCPTVRRTRHRAPHPGQDRMHRSGWSGRIRRIVPQFEAPRPRPVRLLFREKKRRPNVDHLLRHEPTGRRPWYQFIDWNLKNKKKMWRLKIRLRSRALDRLQRRQIQRRLFLRPAEFRLQRPGQFGALWGGRSEHGRRDGRRAGHLYRTRLGRLSFLFRRIASAGCFIRQSGTSPPFQQQVNKQLESFIKGKRHNKK